MKKQIASFSVRNAKCFDDADREVLYTTICEWFGSLDNFNQVVRNDLPIAVESSMGIGMGLVNLQSLYLVGLGGSFLFSFDMLLHVSGIFTACRWLLFGVASMFIWYPLWIIAVSVVEHKFVELQCRWIVRWCIRLTLLPPLGMWVPFSIDLHAHAPMWVLFSYTPIASVLVQLLYSGHHTWLRRFHKSDV